MSIWEKLPSHWHNRRFMKLIEIAAIGQNRELGYKNDLLWHFKEDMNYFRNQTKGHPVVMGRKTFESLPGLLPNRHHIVISRNKNDFPSEVECFQSIEAFLEAYKSSKEEIYVIGGGQIYQEMLVYANTLLLTEIQASTKADVYFPDFDLNQYAKTVIAQEEEQGIVYQFVKYEKLY